MADVDIDREALRKEIDAALHGKKKEPQPPAGFELNQHSSVKHVIGVVSGKGGVGKSFVTGILATNLARAGKRVGILDGDITGPSIPRMFGISDERSYGVEEQLIPIEDANGIKIMSANLVLQNETDPVLWRGPVVAGAIQQFYSQCNWGDLDYLLIDMPPGTGDVALTVFQSLPVEGVVIVSSPQDLVQMVVGKAVRMAEMMHVPVLGLIENMAYITCPHCDERIEPYGPSKLAETAAAFNLKPLGQLPMDATFAQIADKGTFSTELPEGLVPDATQSVLDL
ncbi:MAG: Mrp/NBP35 family ATP-binding protein [Atopobium sp.]|jgi:ATP-binding protein|uniref:Iron-sulfur cluster carrier protein n=2 Tax=Lancefieldella parvula TaxID=1382 RepID=A0A9D5X4M0_9ACTN|nr:MULTISPECIES: Mrp/NBP35 family ATP-binding protein [Atopobiaceae]MBF0906716.1 Mrp/NBP35 family ATP-binding protein [Atopobium sp.]EWC95831.1 ParA/MinD ATPase-like protein [Atopobium sp. ICM42b]MBF0909356.1 Mrp/NBP35 family ATP-binding protein [Atopobium sp.]MBF0946250.1 Mrp/NBP35 family ATP-binding protein [Atopobium sp.]MBF0958084.1 Mrp/NBP35 family ATP-binding protein [Atopobium sp.]